MKTFKDILNEAVKIKPAFGGNRDFNYAVKINGLNAQDFWTLSSPDKLSSSKKAREFTKKADWHVVDAKGKSTMKAVKDWVKKNKPSEFYAQ